MCEKCAVFEKYKTFHVECIPREIFLMYIRSTIAYDLYGDLYYHLF